MARLTGWDDYEDWYPEIQRYYVPAFVRGYMFYVEQAEQKERKEREAAARWKAEREAEEKKEATVQIKYHRLLPDGVLYMVDFFDPVRMTQAVSFGVSVKDDGLVELEEI